MAFLFSVFNLKTVQSSIILYYLSGSITLYICTCSTHFHHRHRHHTIVGSTIHMVIIYWQRQTHNSVVAGLGRRCLDFLNFICKEILLKRNSNKQLPDLCLLYWYVQYTVFIFTIRHMQVVCHPVCQWVLALQPLPSARQ